MTGGIKLDFGGKEVRVIAPASSGWDKLRQLLDAAKVGTPLWDTMDNLVDEIFPPKTRMGQAELRTYLEYEDLRERSVHDGKETPKLQDEHH